LRFGLNSRTHPIGLGTGFVGSAPYPFPLEQVEEALRHGVVVTIPATAHRVFQIVVLKESGPVYAGELGALVRVYQYLVLQLPAPHRHQQRLQENVHCLTALHEPTDNATGIEINHDGQIGEALQRPDVGDVRHPDPVGCYHVEQPVQRVVYTQPLRNIRNQIARSVI
jgi:hypothetical protein